MKMRIKMMVEIEAEIEVTEKMFVEASELMNHETTMDQAWELAAVHEICGRISSIDGIEDVNVEDVRTNEI